MIKFLQKLVILWEKKKFLTLMEMEADYIKQVHKDKLERDLKPIREQLAELRAIKNPKNKVGQEINELETQINETEKIKQMVQSSKDKGQDLKNQIRIYKKNLWR